MREIMSLRERYSEPNIIATHLSFLEFTMRKIILTGAALTLMCGTAFA